MMSTRFALTATVGAVASLHMGSSLPAGVRAAQLRGSERSGPTMAPVPEGENAVAQGSLALGNEGTREERAEKIQLVAGGATASERRRLLERLRLPDGGEEEKQKMKEDAEQAAEAELPDKNTVRVIMPDGSSLNLTFEAAQRVTPQMVREGIVGETGDSSHRHALFLPGGEEELARGDGLVFAEGRAELFALAHKDLGPVWDEFVAKASVPSNFKDHFNFWGHHRTDCGIRLDSTMATWRRNLEAQEDSEQAAARLLALWSEAEEGWTFDWARRWVENVKDRELDDYELKLLSARDGLFREGADLVKWRAD